MTQDATQIELERQAGITLRAELAIKDRLKVYFPAMKVDQMPDDPAGYRAIHPKGEILVGYKGSDYSRPGRGLGAVLQDREYRFDLALMVRNLRHHTDALPLLGKIVMVLTGFPLDGMDPLWCDRDGFVRESEGVWQYSAAFRGKGIHQQAALPGLCFPPGMEPGAPPLKRVSFSTPFGQVEL